jgi:hypothetical protein
MCTAQIEDVDGVAPFYYNVVIFSKDSPVSRGTATCIPGFIPAGTVTMYVVGLTVIELPLCCDDNAAVQYPPYAV